MIKINNRYTLHNYINTNNIKSFVEVGLGYGDYTSYLLESCPGIEYYYSVENFGGRFMHKKMKDQREQVIKRMEKYHPRFILNEGNSTEIAKNFKDNSIDAIYIDGDHSFHGVYGDLVSWYPKLKVGGVWGMHDYVALRRDGIRKSVAKFLPEINMTLDECCVTEDVNPHPSIFWIKK